VTSNPGSILSADADVGRRIAWCPEGVGGFSVWDYSFLHAESERP
jgi:hypothetical protein